MIFKREGRGKQSVWVRKRQHDVWSGEPLRITIRTSDVIEFECLSHFCRFGFEEVAIHDVRRNNKDDEEEECETSLPDFDDVR